jgi:MFS family permease
MKTKDTQALNKRLKPLYLSVFFQGFIFWYAIEKIFMKTIGFNSQTIADETIILTLVTIIMNIPMGVLADRWSRKGVLFLASLSLITCCLIGGFSNSFWTYVIAASFGGLFYACNLGIYDSIVYDTAIEELGTADNFEHHFGKIQMFDGLALVLGSLLSSVIVHFINLRAEYFLTIPLTICAMIALSFFKEPKEHKKEVAELLAVHIKSMLKAIIKKSELFWIIFTLVTITIGLKMLLDFDQLWLIALAFPLVIYGPVDALLLSSFGTGGFLAAKLKSRSSIYAVGLIIMISSLALLTRDRLMVVLAQVIIVTGFTILNIIFGRHLHDRLTSTIRFVA